MAAAAKPEPIVADDAATQQPSPPARDLELLVREVESQRASALRPVGRALQILRYYRKSQLIARAWRTIAPRTGRSQGLLPTGGVRLRGEAPRWLAAMASCRTPRTAQPVRDLGDDLKRGAFTLLAERRELGMPIDWQASASPRPPRLWRFQLHYQEYLLDLAAGAAGTVWHDAEAAATVWSTIASWIDANPPASADRQGDAWHPYCISRRLPVWLQLLAALPPGDDLQRLVLDSLVQQAEFLRRHLETDLGGNHLLENARALALAGCAIAWQPEDSRSSGSDEWLDAAEATLRRELPRQLLPHGEHFERSPLYHCQILGNLLQVAIAAQDVRPRLAVDCREQAARMWSFLAGILHPDGEIPLFGDSCFGESYSIDQLRQLLALAGDDATENAKENSTDGATRRGEYWIWRRGGDSILFDAGPVGADTLPAHAHCDLLGFEASVAGERWLVDSGLFNYEVDSMRAYCRSSVAHNVVTVEDQNQCDAWSAFRMGYRGRPTPLRQGRSGGFDWATAGHDAYRRFGIASLERLLLAAPAGIWGCVDHLAGRRLRNVTGRLHWAPAVEIAQIDEQSWELRHGRVQRVLSLLGAAEARLALGWYCPRFGVRERTRVLEYRAAAGDDVTFGWLLTEPQCNVSAEVVTAGRTTTLTLRDEERGAAFTWQFPSDPGRLPPTRGA